MRMLGPHGNPQARNLFEIIGAFKPRGPAPEGAGGPVNGGDVSNIHDPPLRLAGLTFSQSNGGYRNGFFDGRDRSRHLPQSSSSPCSGKRAGTMRPTRSTNSGRSPTWRIVFVGGKARRGRQKRADYILRYRSHFPIAVVEAKARYKHAAEGLQQARDYAETLGLKFAYATNGVEIIEVDYTTGVERPVGAFPSPEELWRRQRTAEGLTDPCNGGEAAGPDLSGQKQAAALLPGDRRQPCGPGGRLRAQTHPADVVHRIGQTAVAFQIAWKLWSPAGTPGAPHAGPKMLFLADRNVLVDDPMAKDFGVFGDARHRSRAATLRRAVTCTSRPTRASLATRTGRASTGSTRGTSSIS